MKIECDTNTVYCFAWTFAAIVVLGLVGTIGFAVHSYRAERRYAIEHGLTPHSVVTQPVATPDYDTTSNMVINQSNPGLRGNPYVPDMLTR